MNITQNLTTKSTNPTPDSTPILILGCIFLSMSILGVFTICFSSIYARKNKGCCEDDIQIIDNDSDEEEHYGYNSIITQPITTPPRGNNVITSIGIYISESEDESEDESESLPIKKINTFSNINSYPIFCSICQEDKLNTIKTDCNHHFCKECIEESMKMNNNCPLCKNKISSIYEINVLKFIL